MEDFDQRGQPDNRNSEVQILIRSRFDCLSFNQLAMRFGLTKIPLMPIPSSYKTKRESLPVLFFILSAKCSREEISFGFFPMSLLKSYAMGLNIFKGFPRTGLTGNQN